MNNFISIASRQIGEGLPTFIIAEIGVNHDGSVEKALALLHLAAQAGADAAKLQLFSAARLMHPSAGFAQYQQDRVSESTAPDMLRQYELSESAVRQIAAEARKIGLLLLATPFSISDLPLIKSLDLPAIKIASPDLVNKPLLAAAARLSRPLLVSTGASTMDEVAATVGWLNQWRAPFALLHCVSSYPTAAADAHLGWIGELRDRFDVPVGFSDHTTELSAGALAVATGAIVVEKHLTHDRAATGPDHAASFDGQQFAQYVHQIRQAHAMLGNQSKHVLEIEQDVRRVSRQSLVLARPVAAGAKLVQEDFACQRPGTGVPAAALEELLGRAASRSLNIGEMLNWDMVA